MNYESHRWHPLHALSLTNLLRSFLLIYALNLLKEVSFLSFILMSVEQNARDKQMTTPVTEGARRGLDARASRLPSLNLKKKEHTARSLPHVITKSFSFTLNSLLHSATAEIKPCINWSLTRA